MKIEVEIGDNLASILEKIDDKSTEYVGDILCDIFENVTRNADKFKIKINEE